MLQVRRTQVIALIALLGVAEALTGCANPDAGSDPANAQQLEVVTSWPGGDEKAAVHQLVETFTSSNPGIRFLDASVRGADGDSARRAIRVRLETGNPPDSFLIAAGPHVEQYVAAGHGRTANRLFVGDDPIQSTHVLLRSGV